MFWYVICYQQIEKTNVKQPALETEFKGLSEFINFKVFVCHSILPEDLRMFNI